MEDFNQYEQETRNGAPRRRMLVVAAIVAVVLVVAAGAVFVLLSAINQEEKGSKEEQFEISGMVTEVIDDSTFRVYEPESKTVHTVFASRSASASDEEIKVGSIVRVTTADNPAEFFDNEAEAITIKNSAEERWRNFIAH